MTTIEGYIEKIVFENKENGYKILQFHDNRKDAPHGEDVTVVGVFPDVSEGDFLFIEGNLTVHHYYGEQIHCIRYERRTPSDVSSIYKYLSSGAISGIGPGLAIRIVDRFKEDSLRIIEEEPERLAEIKGISEKMARNIAETNAEKREMRAALMFLQKYGITINLGIKIYNKYGINLYSVLRENPYQLAEDIRGVGFKIADEIAKKVGIIPESAFRIKSGLLYVLQNSISNGFTYLPKEPLLRLTSQLLNVSTEMIEEQFKNMILDRSIIVKEKELITAETGIEREIQVYSTSLYHTERNIASRLKDLSIDYSENAYAANHFLSSNDVLDDVQKSAVLNAITHGVSIITGGPGTGKTTTINTLISLFIDESMEICLAAPTGRAAKRMQEATGYEAQTIHRLLEIQGGMMEKDDVYVFGRDENNPLTCDVIIIDEMSMVDVLLMNSLLRAIVPGTRLVLVGDVDQLPSVGPGNVLRDLIHSDLFAVARLATIYRQSNDSDIIDYAHKINHGEAFSPRKGSRDFFFIHRDQAELIIGATITLLNEKLPRYLNIDRTEIQVLSPMKKGPLGVINLNRAIQAALNPKTNKKVELETISCIFREGDKVMQVKNNYQIEWEITNKYNIPEAKGTGVFNGDMGTIAQINLITNEMIVKFDDNRRVTYSTKQLDEIELAYAITIHKSQGSEYPAVILPLLSGPPQLMNRNLLYTAITRAKNCATIIGSEDTFHAMILNSKQQVRYSGLLDRLCE